MTTLAQTYRQELAGILERSQPGAPTLCEGWTCADLAAHLYVRENDPLAAPGLLAAPLSGITAARMRHALRRFGYLGLLATFALGPRPWSPMALPGVDRLANGVEYFVHHEDVRRAREGWSDGELPDAALSEELWQRLSALARFMARRCPVGLRLERTDVDPVRSVAAHPGNPIVTVTGHPAELTLWLYGRPARVEFIGDPEPVELLGRMSRKV